MTATAGGALTAGVAGAGAGVATGVRVTGAGLEGVVAAGGVAAGAVSAGVDVVDVGAAAVSVGVLPGGWIWVPVVLVAGASSQTCAGTSTVTRCTGSSTSPGTWVLLAAVVVLPLVSATVLTLRARAAR